MGERGLAAIHQGIKTNMAAIGYAAIEETVRDLECKYQ